MIRFRILMFEDCPGWKPTMDHLEEVAEKNLEDYDIELMDVTQDSELPPLFLGSPTILYQEDGKWKELFGLAGEPTMACRTYEHDSCSSSFIPKDLIEQRIKELFC